MSDNLRYFLVVTPVCICAAEYISAYNHNKPHQANGTRISIFIVEFIVEFTAFTIYTSIVCILVYILIYTFNIKATQFIY